jgi:hypothetical protein
VVMPVTFPDGSTAEVVYPPELHLASMSVHPFYSGCNGDLNFFYRHDPRGTWYGGEGPLSTYPGAESSEVTRWKGLRGREDYYLRFRFEDWIVLKYDRSILLTEAQRAACARALRGRQTADGFLVLSMPTPPGSVTGLTERNDPTGAGPTMMFGDLASRLIVRPGRCSPSPEDGVIDTSNVNPATFASWCEPEAPMTVHVYDDRNPDFIHAVREGLEFRDVRLST